MTRRPRPLTLSQTLPARLRSHHSKTVTDSLTRTLLSVIQWSEEAAGLGKERQRQLAFQLLEWLRNIYIEHLAASQISCAPAAEMPQLRLWAAHLPAHFYSRAAAAVNGALSDIDRNVNAKMTFYSVALHLFFAA